MRKKTIGIFAASAALCALCVVTNTQLLLEGVVGATVADHMVAGCMPAEGSTALLPAVVTRTAAALLLILTAAGTLFALQVTACLKAITARSKLTIQAECWRGTLTILQSPTINS